MHHTPDGEPPLWPAGQELPVWPDWLGDVEDVDEHTTIMTVETDEGPVRYLTFATSHFDHRRPKDAGDEPDRTSAE